MPNNHERYVKSYPRYVGSPIWSDDSLFKLFHYCLYKASHNTCVWRNTVIHPGEFPISIRHAAEELNWSTSTLQAKLQLLQKSGFVYASSSKKGTILRVSDWENSQGVSAFDETCTENQYIGVSKISTLAPMCSENQHTGVSEIDTLTPMCSENQHTGVSEIDTPAPMCSENQHTGVSEISKYQNNNINTTHYYTSPLAEPEGFTTLWLAYPIDRRTNREIAANLYREAIKSGATLDSMIAALEADKQSVTWLKESGRYIPGIVKWLQREAWRDYLTQEASEEEEEWETL